MHKQDKLEWHISASKQDFKVRMARDIQSKYPGAVITDVSVTLEILASRKPGQWVTTGKEADIASIITDDFDPDNTVAQNAVYFVANKDVDGDPVPGYTYRWHVVAELDNGFGVVAKPEVELVP